jgi:hypothetical protein
MPTNTYTPIASVTLSATASEVVFSGLPQTFRDLIFVINGGVVSGGHNVLISFNGDTAANYTAVQMSGTGSSVDGSAAFGRLLNYFGFFTGDLNSMIKAEVFDYAQTNKHKTYLSRASSAGNGVAAVAGRWANTNAITAVTLTSQSPSSFRIGTSLTVFGVIA